MHKIASVAHWWDLSFEIKFDIEFDWSSEFDWSFSLTNILFHPCQDMTTTEEVVAAAMAVVVTIVTKRCGKKAKPDLFLHQNLRIFSQHLLQDPILHIGNKETNKHFTHNGRPVDGFGDSWLHLGYDFNHTFTFGSSFSFSLHWPVGSLYHGRTMWRGLAFYLGAV